MLLDRQVLAIIICNQSLLLFGIRLRLLYAILLPMHTYIEAVALLMSLATIFATSRRRGTIMLTEVLVDI